MKKIGIIIISIIVAGATGGYIYWSMNKRKIVKDALQQAVKNSSDSLYRIQYDSSFIDEVSGTASFFNVRMQSDQLQQRLLASTDSLPNVLFLVKVAEVTARGVDVPGLLQKNNVKATSITIIEPVIQIINTGADRPKPFTYKDTLEVYQRILGDFSSIAADTIRIVNGTLLMTNRAGKALTTVEKININLRKFLIDSSKNYENVVSYFIKDVNVSVSNIQLPETEKDTRVNIINVVYDAPRKQLQIGNIQQYQTGNSVALVDLHNIVFTGLNTTAFINRSLVQAEAVSCDGGLVTVYNRKKKGTASAEEKSVALSSDFIDGIQIKALRAGNTNILIKDPDQPNVAPLEIKNVKFTASEINPVTDGSTLSAIIGSATWEISAENFSFPTKEKMYTFNAKNITANSKGMLTVGSMALKPQLSELAFARAVRMQRDRYDFSFNNIEASGVDIKKLLTDKTLVVDLMKLQPVLKIYNDRTQPPEPSEGKKLYPNQSLLKLPVPLMVRQVVIKNGGVYYKERGEVSRMTGLLRFSQINGSIDNVTNMPEYISKNSKLTLNATALFLGAGKLTTKWVLPLKASDSIFTISAELGAMHATVVNAVTKPLAMVAIQKGEIDHLEFSIKGSDYKGTGELTLLYNDLTATALKLKNKELKKKGLLTFVANTLIKNDNPQNGKTRISEMDFDRDLEKSFFNLLWKTIFSGVKNAALGR